MSEQPIHPDDLRFAAQAAHQLKGPVAAVKMTLRMLLGDFAGPLSEKQKELVLRASARCDQALESVSRILAIARATADPQPIQEVTDLAKVARRALVRYAQDALAADISLSADVGVESIHVRGHEPALFEAVCALLDNALKYTPEFGRVRLALEWDEQWETVRLGVADSGVGIAEKNRPQVFTPFFRTPATKRSAHPGTGLGLAFVKAVVESGGGAVRVEPSDLGGVTLTMELPYVPVEASQELQTAGESKPMKVVIVGGVAAGPKAASKIIRLNPRAEVTVVEKGRLLSYAGCGLPYYVSGVIQEQKGLMSTPAGLVRDAVFFQKVKNVHVMNKTEAIKIDRPGKRLQIRDLIDGRQSWLEYDKLVLAIGATPVIPNVPGVELENLFTLHGVRDAEGLKASLARRKAREVVIVGAGLIGVEFTEGLVQAGCRVTLVEMQPQILGILDWEIAKLVENHMESKGVRVLTGTRVESFRGEGKVEEVVTDHGSLRADIVVLAGGVRPNVGLAEQAGLEIGPTGAIRVDPTMRTSAPDVYAAGDCVEQIDLVTGRPCYVPLGSTANKQGRVAAINVCGGRSEFPGVLGTTVCRVFDYCVGRTGLSEVDARAAGYDVVSVLAPGPDREHFIPGAAMLLLKIVVDRDSRRLLGAQATGPGAADKRIDVAAMAITAGMTVEQIANTDLCYAPPYAPAMDNIITAANVAGNKLDGQMVGISPLEVEEKRQRHEDFLLLDVRSPAEHEQVRLPGATLIPLGTLRGRLDELPRDKTIVAFCNISLRAYEAALILKAAGFRDARVMDGGVEMWPYEKLS